MPRDAYRELLAKAQSTDLSKALSATLLAAHDANTSDFVTWIRLELLGYSAPVMTDDMEVPEYRTVGGQWFDDHGRRLNITDPKLSFINEYRLRQGVVELESFVGVQGTISLRALDLASALKQPLGVEVTTFCFSPQAVVQVLANIRAQLLDRLATHRAEMQRAAGSIALPQGQDIIQIRPGYMGINVDLRALWRRLQSKN